MLYEKQDTGNLSVVQMLWVSLVAFVFAANHDNLMSLIFIITCQTHFRRQPRSERKERHLFLELGDLGLDTLNTLLLGEFPATVLE